MIRALVHRRDACVARNADALHERIGVRREPVVGGQGQQRDARESRRRDVEGPLRRAGEQVVRHALRGDAGQRFHVVGHEADQLCARHGSKASHVRRRDHDGAEELGMVRGGVGDHPAAHTVAGDDD